MKPNKKDPSSNAHDAPWPPADYGNASNPSPHSDADAFTENQLLNEGAEKYLREVASIEDVPDAQDQQEMDETIEESKHDEQ